MFCLENEIEFKILHYFPHFMCLHRLHKYRILFNRPNDKYKCIAKAHSEKLFISEKRWLEIGKSARASWLEKFTWIIQLTATIWCIVFQGPHPSTDVIFFYWLWTLACAAQSIGAKRCSTLKYKFYLSLKNFLNKLKIRLLNWKNLENDQ